MATNFTELKPGQAEWAEKIVKYGIENGYSPEVTKSVLSLANDESSLGDLNLNHTSGAEGVWQFMAPSHIQDELNVYRENRPDGQYAALSAREVFRDQDAVMAVMFEQVKVWKQDFDNGGILPSRLESKLQQRDGQLNEIVHTDFNSYTFYRHNTSVKQTHNMVYGKDVGILETNERISNYVNTAYGLHYDLPGPQQSQAVAEFRQQLNTENTTFAGNQQGMQIAQNTYAATGADAYNAETIINQAGFEGSAEQRARLAELLADRLKDYRPVKGDLSASISGRSGDTQQLFGNDAGSKTVEPEDNQFRL